MAAGGEWRDEGESGGESNTFMMLLEPILTAAVSSVCFAPVVSST